MALVYLVLRDGGHGDGTAGKRTPFLKSLGRSVREHEFNQPVTDVMGRVLERHGVYTVDVAAGQEDIPLKTRTDAANKLYYQYCKQYGTQNVVCVYVSVHFNASDGKFDGDAADPSGFSVHIQPGHRAKSAGQLAQAINDQLKAGTTQKNRGIVEQDLFVTRETAMPAALIECGFMDNEREAMLMLDRGFQEETGTEVAKGVLAYMGIAYMTEPVQETPQPANHGKTGFPDVPAGHWAEDAIAAAKEAGIIGGYQDGTFGLGKPVTREEMAAIVANLLGRL